MTHQIIKTENYLLVVDESNYYDEYYLNKVDMRIYKRDGGGNIPTEGGVWHKKITHHLPLNNAPTLEGVELLPPLEDDVYLYATQEHKFNHKSVQESGFVLGVKVGYNKVKEEYKYTEEDMREAYNLGLDTHSKQNPNKAYDELIQSLQQPKYPVAFESEMIDKGEEDWIGDDINGEPFWNQKLEPKKITNSQGLTQIVGKYIYATS